MTSAIDGLMASRCFKGHFFVLMNSKPLTSARVFNPITSQKSILSSLKVLCYLFTWRQMRISICIHIDMIFWCNQTWRNMQLDVVRRLWVWRFHSSGSQRHTFINTAVFLGGNSLPIYTVRSRNSCSILQVSTSKHNSKPLLCFMLSLPV